MIYSTGGVLHPLNRCNGLRSTSRYTTKHSQGEPNRCSGADTAWVSIMGHLLACMPPPYPQTAWHSFQQAQDHHVHRYASCLIPGMVTSATFDHASTCISVLDGRSHTQLPFASLVGQNSLLSTSWVHRAILSPYPRTPIRTFPWD